MTLTEPGYRTRLVDSEITAALETFGALSIEGPKYCGKTWTALNHANSATYISDPAGGFATRARAQLDPSLVLDGASPHLVDEWQEVPGIWDAVRFSADRSSRRGLYILTGSTMPPKNSVVHSGAGRIETIRMHTLTLYESGYSNGSISLESLIASRTIDPANSKATLQSTIEVAVRGGWPESEGLSLENAARVPRNYLTRLITEDLSQLDGIARDPAKVRASLISLARNTATLVTNATIKKDVDAGNQSISRDTIAEYLAAFKRLYVLDEIPAWVPNVRSRSRLRTSPKRMLTDQSLAVAALGLTPQKLYDDLNTFGFIFESMCLKDLIVYAEAFGANIKHYLDETGLDADAIIELPDGGWVGVEIKLGENQVDEAAAKLLRLEKKLTGADANPAICNIVITGIGSYARKREDGVFVIPIDCLKP